MNNGMNRSRREFLKMGAAGLAGAAFLPTGGCSGRSGRDTPGVRKIVRRTLGRTGLRLPVVSMGSSYAINLTRAALDEGIVYIHTSSGYAENNHERLLGTIFREIPRESFVVATSPDLPYRFGGGSGRSSDIGRSADPDRIAESLDGSLGRLGLDHVDIYYMVSVGSREAVLYEPYMNAFEKLKREGKIRFAGIGTHQNEPEVIRAAAGSGFWDVVLTSYNFRQTHRDEVRSAIAAAAGAGLGVVAMKTQASVYWDRMRLRRINMKAALKWVLEDENVTTTIPAFSNFDEMYEDLSIMEDLALTPEERGDLRLGDELGYSGHYCQQCRVCVAQCPAGMDIPTLMRSYMYAYGHGEPWKARETLRSWSPADIACGRCGSCAVRCSLRFDVKSRVLDIARILEVPNEFIV